MVDSRATGQGDEIPAALLVWTTVHCHYDQKRDKRPRTPFAKKHVPWKKVRKDNDTRLSYVYTIRIPLTNNYMNRW